MDVNEAIRQRYSVRAYQDKPVEQVKLDVVLDAAREAPSANNRQAWKFVVIRDPAIRQSLADDGDQPFVAEAPIVIAIVGLDGQRVMSCGVPADPVDCSIAGAYMTLQATAQGLGTCWIGRFKQDHARELLGVPRTAAVVSLMTLGYPADSPRRRKRKTIEEVVSYDRF